MSVSWRNVNARWQPVETQVAATLDDMDERASDRPSGADERRAEADERPDLTSALAAWENEGGAIVVPATAEPLRSESRSA